MDAQLEFVSEKLIRISWEDDNGFGVFDIFKDGDTWKLDDETCGKKKVKSAFCEVIDNLELHV